MRSEETLFSKRRESYQDYLSVSWIAGNMFLCARQFAHLQHQSSSGSTERMGYAKAVARLLILFEKGIYIERCSKDL